MAYAIDGTDLVIAGWENGISDNPYQGINDMRGVNIISIPGEASVSFASNLLSFSPLVVSVTSVDTSTGIFTGTATTGALNTVQGGQVVVFSNVSGLTGITAGTDTAGPFYWITALSATTFKVSSSLYDFYAPTYVVPTLTGTATATSIDINEIRYFDKGANGSAGATYGYVYCIDIKGRAWVSANGKYYIYLGNTTTDGSVSYAVCNGNGIQMFTASNGTRYLFIFRNGSMDYMVENGYSWVYQWDYYTAASHTGQRTMNSGRNNVNHECLMWPSNNKMYFTDGNYVCSLSENAGKVFSPTDTTTYSWVGYNSHTNTNFGEINVVNTETFTCLAVLGMNLLVGGSYNILYSWDRVSANVNNLIIISDNYTSKLLTVNSNTYIFAGVRGRIYVTNSSNATLYSKLPDNISGLEPFYTWKGVAYNKNQIYFGVSASNNSGTAISTYNGLWTIDISTDALRVPILMSTTTANVMGVVPYQPGLGGNASGFGLMIAWKDNASTTYGIDVSSSTPYTTYVAYIETDIIPVGQFLNKKSFNNMEFKLAAPLASGESIKISYRTSKTGTYALVGETTYTYSTANPVGPISDVYSPLPFEQVQWIQFRVDMKSTATNPSFVRLVEIRLR